MSWRKNLNNHAIFSHLRESQHKQILLNKSQHILALHDGEIFIWNHCNSSIATCNLKYLIGKSQDELHTLAFQVYSVFIRIVFVSTLDFYVNFW